MRFWWFFPLAKEERESHKRSSIQSLFNRGGAESTRVPCILQKTPIFFRNDEVWLTRMISRLQMLHVEVRWVGSHRWSSDYGWIHRVVAPFHTSLDVLFHIGNNLMLHFTLTIGCGTLSSTCLLLLLLFLHHHFLLVSWMYHENGQAVLGDFGRIRQLVLNAAVHKKRLGKVLARRRSDQTSTATFHWLRLLLLRRLSLPDYPGSRGRRQSVHSSGWPGCRMVIWKTSTWCRRTHSVFHVDCLIRPGVAQMGVTTASASVEDVWWDLVRLQGCTIGAHDGGRLARCQHGHGAHVGKMVGGWMYHRNHFGMILSDFVFFFFAGFRRSESQSSLDQRPEHTGASFGGVVSRLAAAQRDVARECALEARMRRQPTVQLQC